MKSNYQITAATAETNPIIGTIHSIAVSEIHPFACSPFKVRNDDSMQELIQSVRALGVLIPIEVRPCVKGGYEIVAGARRHYAAVVNHLKHIPAIIVNMDDEDAIIRLVDSNIQRENMLPSERAYAYKMRMDAIKRKAGRPKKPGTNNSPNYSANFRSDDYIGQLTGISGDTVRNYISLTQLIPDLMKLVDERKISLTPAYQIASLSSEEQALLVETIESEQVTPSLSQAQRMRKLSQSGQLNEDSMLLIMMEQKKPIPDIVTLPSDRLRKYFPKHYSPDQIETFIFKLLDIWLAQKKRK